jgi:hypothetical protein
MRNSPALLGFERLHKRLHIFLTLLLPVTSTGPIIERLLIEMGVIAGISTAIQPPVW